MSAEIILNCWIYDTDLYEVFAVDIPLNDIVNVPGHLKKAIITEMPVTFKGVEADVLELYKVRNSQWRDLILPSNPWQVEVSDGDIDHFAQHHILQRQDRLNPLSSL